MSARTPRLLAGAIALLAAAALIAVAASAPERAPGAGGGAVVVQPATGLPVASLVLAGAAPAGAPGEAWGYGTLRGPASDAAGAPLPTGAYGFALVRHTDADGWTLQRSAGTEAFRPLDGPAAGRVTPAGGVAIAGLRDTADGTRATLLVRDPGATAAPLPDPDVTVLEPSERLLRAGGTALAAVDEGGRTGVFAAAFGGAVDAAVLHWDGHAWSREPIAVPPDSADSLQVLALAASSAGNAWLLAQESPGLGRGVVLFQRVADGAGARWEERLLDPSPFAQADPPGTGVQALAGRGWPAEPLSVTPRRVWVDATAQAGGVARDVVLAYDVAAGRVARSWCDVVTSGGAPLCDLPLGSGLASNGYRSFAFDGPAGSDGTRIVTNAPAVPGSDGTSHGVWLELDDAGAARRPGIGGSGRTAGARGGAFAAPDDGWLGGVGAVGRVTRTAVPARLVPWPLNVRHPLAAAATAPGAAPGDLAVPVLAVGAAGTIVRYAPGRGWSPEFLLNGVGQRLAPSLRGVAWPEPARAYAVGDNGEMWLWRGETGLWERDEAAPNDFVAQLTGVAFAPGDPSRGYVVGKGGVLLRYGKTWTQEQLPAAAQGANLTSIAFAGGQALVTADRHLLVDDGGGWRVDPSAEALLAARPDARLFAVAGLPDGGAVAAGRGIVLERDGPATPWRVAPRPLAGVSSVAAAAIREDGRVRAVLSVATGADYPKPDILPPSDPGQPPPLLGPNALPPDGLVLRESASGWRDEQHGAWEPSTDDLPAKPDAVLAFALSPAGSGWAFGGITGEELTADAASKARSQTAAAYRYEAGDAAPAAPPGAGRAAVPEPTALVRFAIGGHAACLSACADLANQALGPDRILGAGLGVAAQLATQPHGPRAFLYTGTRVDAAGGGLAGAEAARYAALAASVPGAPPFFPALGAGDAPGGDAAAFRGAFAGFARPLGAGEPPAAIDTASIPGAPADPRRGARTHYAFDSYGAEGAVRVIVVDDSAGSLAASDPAQNPREPQEPWLAAVLDDARANDLPAIVVGDRSLDASDPAAASDADRIARLLLDHGASAYFYDSPQENRARRIPAGSPVTLPAFGSGTLGYPRPQVNAGAYFGETGLLLAEIDPRARDPQTNRAPVGVRLIPVLEDLSVDATDGTLLRRSRVALFQGLGRLPRAGRANRPTEAAPPYVALPPTPCVGDPACVTKIAPEYAFSSADPDLGDFVAHDPKSINPRAVLLDARGRPVHDPTSGLFCAFNAGATSVTIAAGGFAYTQPVRILDGAVQRPCGTRPLDPRRFPPRQPHSPPPPPGGAPISPQIAAVVPPPPPPAAPAPSPPPPAPAPPLYAPPLAAAPPPPPPIAVPPPPVSSFARPIPPGGAVVRVFEEKREEEAAPESQSAFAAYHPDDRWLLPGPLAALLLAALVAAGAGTAVGRARRPRRHAAPAYARRRA